MSDYSLAAKALHYMALSSNVVKKMAFDVDCLISRTQKFSGQMLPPVFISGLARGGTTILLEALYSSRQFKTITYRNMPFITAPLVWKLLTAGQYKNADLKERAHGDGLHVGFDSPEAFEEVFWLTFTDPSYVLKDCLIPHVPDTDVLDQYRQFVSHVTAEKGSRQFVRYLAKNNNNILRIGSLKKTFPDSFIIVPFRNPLDQAKSLLNQHNKFKQVQSEDGFTLKYMTWLGHFEFGLNFKPFKFSESSLPRNSSETCRLSYWIRYWESVYQYLMRHHAKDVIFFDYDKFCASPMSVLTTLSRKLDIEEQALTSFCGKVQSTTQYPLGADEELLQELVQDTYCELQSMAM